MFVEGGHRLPFVFYYTSGAFVDGLGVGGFKGSTQNCVECSIGGTRQSGSAQKVVKSNARPTNRVFYSCHLHIVGLSLCCIESSQRERPTTKDKGHLSIRSGSVSAPHNRIRSFHLLQDFEELGVHVFPRSAWEITSVLLHIRSFVLFCAFQLQQRCRCSSSKPNKGIT